MGKRQYVVKGTTFDVDERYQVKKGVGQGAYGLICAAKDTVSGESVAVKKINNAFEDAVDCKRILRELKLLRHFNHENVLSLRDIMTPPPGKPETWKDMYLVTELLDTDLHYIIHSKQALTDDHIQYFAYQLLRGLKCIHAARVLHRDLKPGNLLVNKNCDLKICDFGLARGIDHEATANKLTEYVVTRWYRAPELLVENEQYNEAIDMWSVGCILAEFLGRKALFPGRDYLQQLRLIIDVLGTPTASDLAIIQNEQAVEYLKSLPKKEKASFKKMFPNSNPLAVELLEKMLVFDPSKRVSAAEALAHPYMEALHNVNDEPVAEPFDFDFEKAGVGELDLKRMIWQQLAHHHPEVGEPPEEWLAQPSTSSR
ncbi:hypothetical protein KFE25_003425 [Diacronema lutheri]|uniref:Mitogen-activated protein kinase n=1 Tax=Diacronema lutheri TaxID=2081491 RepID=A0A8J6C7C1_DIALT|nr:hypothetical protein KFE25_003425 [Diacronema lutheri]